MNGVKRFLVILFSTALSFLLQMIAFPKIPYLIAVPNMMLIEVLSIGFLFGRKLGLLTGVICGILLDIMGTGTYGFYTLIFAWLGYGDGLLSEKMESELIPVLVVLFIANEFLYHLYCFALAFFVKMKFSLIPYVKGVVIPEALLTLVLFIIIYGILIFISRKWDLKVNKGEVRVV